MTELRLMDEAEELKTHTIILEMEPFNGGVEVDVYPKTRKLINEAAQAAKRNPIYNRHHEFDKEKGKKVSVAGRPDEAFVQELADRLIFDWRGVNLGDQPAECNRENKIKFFNNVEVGNFIVQAAGEIGQTEDAADEKNL
jgi:hypothetical protein